MSALSSPTKRRVLVIGAALTKLAEPALPGAAIETVDAASLDAALLRRIPPDLVLIDVDAGDAVELGAIIGLLAQQTPAPAALLVGAHLPAALVRVLLRLEHSDVLEAPFTPAQLARSVQGLLSPGASSTPHAQCWSVLSAVGGAGATTLAIEMTARIALCAPRARVGLIDLNLADGVAAAYLGATANMNLIEAGATPERIDAALLNTYAVKVGGGFDLFASPRDPAAFNRHSAVAICKLLEVACQTYDWLVVDLPRVRQPWSVDVLAGSDEVIIVSELTVPALLAARALTAEIESELVDGPQPRIVLNRMARRAFGPAPSRTEAEKALGRKVDGAITSDWEAAACSVNLGGPISHHRPRSRIVKDIAVLVDGLAANRGAASNPAKVAS